VTLKLKGEQDLNVDESDIATAAKRHHLAKVNDATGFRSDLRVPKPWSRVNARVFERDADGLRQRRRERRHTRLSSRQARRARELARAFHGDFKYWKASLSRWHYFWEYPQPIDGANGSRSRDARAQNIPRSTDNRDGL
jgi:hypothetical protein